MIDNHTDRKRYLTDTDLSKLPVTDLYEIAGLCDVEPADEKVCDFCAAYLIAQDKEFAQRG
jgi:hypothetical protein